MKKLHAEKVGKLLTYILMLTFVAGVVAGSVFAMLSAGKNTLTVTSASKLTVFAESFKSFLKPCFIIWLSGFTGISVYFSATTLAYRGGIFGYLVAFIIKNHGIGPALCVTLPQNIIFFPFLLFISLCAALQKKKGLAGYFLTLGLIVIVCALSALLDTYLTSFLIRITL
ncbi:MAG: stage II sporulation protein M [Clostridia bacterium]|nr:stage II sporulation protein M [Clostridia bacterium]